MNSLPPASPVNTVLLTGEKATATDLNLRKLGEFLGITVSQVAITTKLLPEFVSQKSVMVSADNLRQLIANQPDADLFFESILPKVEHLFVFGFAASSEHAELLSKLTRGVLLRASPVKQSSVRYSVGKNPSLSTGALTGLSFEGKCGTADVIFEPNAASSGIEEIIQLDGQAYFVGTNSSGTKIFLSGGKEICDLDASLGAKDSLLDRFGSLAPAMIFFRAAHGKHCWHNEKPMACFVIDDPLLRKKYGFLEFSILQKSLRRHSATVSLAFIPWNAKRTNRDVASMFRETPEHLTLSVHGCDHTRAEFGLNDQALLVAKSREALSKMSRHENLFSVPFDRVMVFPQGIFSRAAMPALKAAGFMAAVNTSAHAVDESRVRLRDLLAPAVMVYEDFPLFVRRYPRNIAETAFDLFLGKPALMVEHHGYFRDQLAAFDSYLAQVNSLKGGVRWHGLGSICSRTCWRKMDASGRTQIRFYTPQFVFENDTPIKQAFTFFKRERNPSAVHEVKVNHRTIAPVFAGEDLTFAVELAPGEKAEIAISPPPTAAECPAQAKPLWQGVNITARRYLSEFRDNVLSQSALATKLLATYRSS